MQGFCGHQNSANADVNVSNEALTVVVVNDAFTGGVKVLKLSR